MIRIIIWARPFSRYLLVAWTLTIITVSSIPSLPTLKIHTANSEFRLDYVFHFCEYGLLAFLGFLSFAGDEFRPGFRKFIIITVYLLAFAVLDEFHQKLIPGRSFNHKDIWSNITGILTAMLFCMALFRTMAEKSGKIHQG
jgi:VanZ family protein